MGTAIMEKKQEMAFLTPEEWNRLYRSIDSIRDKAIFLTAYTYGLRASEIGLIRVSDIDFARDRIYIHRLKGSDSGEWPLLPNVAKAIKRWMKERQKKGLGQKDFLFVSKKRTPIHRTHLHKLMKKYGKKAGLPEYKTHFHVLKHSRAMHLLEQTHDIVGTKWWLGHKNISNTMRYVHMLGLHRFEFAKKMKM